MRPRIGITTSTLQRNPEGSVQLSTALPMTYVHCVYQAGGLPLLLPNLPHPEQAEEIIGYLDGILFSGGGDVDPANWQEAPHPALGTVDTIRDFFEFALLHAALQRDIPMLGICRGIQVMAVATGGDLWQDIPSQCPNSLVHQQPAGTIRHEPVHKVSVQPDTLLAHVFWPENSTDYQLCVNSFHHQAPRNCGSIFHVVAVGEDEIIEALAIPDAYFALGVQWHPEEMAAVDELQARLFSSFVSAARARC